MNKRSDEIEAYKKKLNGTIGHYEKISYNISKYLSDNKNITIYLSSIEESELRMSLQRWIEEKEKNPKFVYAADLWVTSNVLRKLIFEWSRFEEIAFKEYFVLGCYCYAEVDRNKILKSMGRKPLVSPMKDKQDNKNNGDTETVNPYKVNKSNFRLLPLDTKGTDPDVLQFEYKGAPVELNRKNLDPANNTITSKVQAQIYTKDGEWYLANCSELKTTYVQVTKPIKIDKGDIIVFGDKYFSFD